MNVKVKSEDLEIAKRNVKNAREETQKMTLDMNALSNVTRAGVSILREFGVASLLSLGAIAATAPSLAGIMAKIAVSVFKIADTLGKALKPAFELFEGALKGVASFLQANPFVAQLVGAFIILASTAVSSAVVITAFKFTITALGGAITTIIGATGIGGLIAGLEGIPVAAESAATALAAGSPLMLGIAAATVAVAGIALIGEAGNALDEETRREAYSTGTHIGKWTTNWETGEQTYEDIGQTGSASSANYIGPGSQYWLEHLNQDSHPYGIGIDKNWTGPGSKDINLNITIQDSGGKVLDYSKYKFGTNVTTGG